MKENSDLDLLSKIDAELFEMEFHIDNKNIIKQLIKAIRIKMYKYKATKQQLLKEKQQLLKEKGNKICTMYSEDIERLYILGFTSEQISIITGVELPKIKDYLKRRELVKWIQLK